MSTYERGLIRNVDNALVERDFRGLRYGNITPTDVDAFLEFGNRLFIFVESKFKSAKFGGGQMLALQRLTDAIHNPPLRYSSCIVIEQHEKAERIDYAACRVRAYRWFGKWRQPRTEATCREAIDRLIDYVNRPPIRRVA